MGLLRVAGSCASAVRRQRPMVYSQSIARAAALTPSEDGSLEVVSVLGMRWELGKAVSRRSLRELRPLMGGRPWS